MADNYEIVTGILVTWEERLADSAAGIEGVLGRISLGLEWLMFVLVILLIVQVVNVMRPLK